MASTFDKSELWRLAVSIAALTFGLTWTVAASAQDAAPLSDPENADGWVLNENVSDEFEGSEIDREKWLVQGDRGKYYNWEGRAPSQFAAHNVIVEDGLLKLRNQWEPDFKFIDKERAGSRYGDPKAPVTAAAVVSKHRFLYGYMEARTKASNSNMTSSFWTIGHQSELDMYEQMGNPKKEGGSIERDTLNSAIHDWRPGKYKPEFGQNKTFNNKHRLGFNVADDFHVYGTEWGPDYLKFYVDGELIREVSREEIGEGWVLTNPLELWFDAEIFSWLGYPHAEELPADYEIDYVRVWQKPSDEQLAPAFFGFEGPMIYPEFDRPMVGEDKDSNKFAQDWYFHGPAAKQFEIVEYENFHHGKRSLKYTPGPTGQKLTVFAPYGSIDMGSGDYELSARIFVTDTAGTMPNTGIQFTLDEPFQQLPALHLSSLKRGEWVNVKWPLKRKGKSGAKDRLRLSVMQAPSEEDGAVIYFDDISIRPTK